MKEPLKIALDTFRTPLDSFIILNLKRIAEVSTGDAVFDILKNVLTVLFGSDKQLSCKNTHILNPSP